MNAAFVDTSYYLALLNENDEFHHAALEATKRLPPKLVTTAWILLEFANGMRRVGCRDLAAEFIRDLRNDYRVSIVQPALDMFDRGLKLYADRPDKEWSLTDCISFLVMKDRGLTEALTTDGHFRQAGFQMLISQDRRA